MVITNLKTENIQKIVKDDFEKSKKSTERLIQNMSTLGCEIIEYSPLPIAAAMTEKHIIGYANLAFCNLVGKNKEDLIGQPFAEAGSETEHFIDIMDRVYFTGKAETGGENGGVGSNIRYRSCLVWAIPNTEGSSVGIVIQLQLSLHNQQLTEMNQELMLSALRQNQRLEVSEDWNKVLQKEISERKLLEEKLKKNEELLRGTNKELESFSYSVSHDLKAPLRAIKGFSHMILKDDSITDAETRRKLVVINDNAEKMQRLIDGLLTLSRIGRQNITFNWIDMEALVKDIWTELENAYSSKTLILKTNGPQQAFGNQTLIRQVLTNLLSNAVKYSVNQTSIEVEVGSCQMDEGNVYYVKDKGVGFDMKHSDKVFEVFQRLHSDSEFEGTGIGLSIAQRIIHLHGGRIWAEGEVGKGACFYFSLPVRSQ